MNTIERLKAIKEHFSKISIEDFEQNLVRAGMTNNHAQNVDKLCTVENYILENERALNKDDTYMLHLLETIMDQYTYGWYITRESIFEQLKSINQFKIHILGKMK
jgi:hypothetical protein